MIINNLDATRLVDSFIKDLFKPLKQVFCTDDLETFYAIISYLDLAAYESQAYILLEHKNTFYALAFRNTQDGLLISLCSNDSNLETISSLILKKWPHAALNLVFLENAVKSQKVTQHITALNFIFQNIHIYYTAEDKQKLLQKYIGAEQEAFTQKLNTYLTDLAQQNLIQEDTIQNLDFENSEENLYPISLNLSENEFSIELPCKEINTILPSNLVSHYYALRDKTTLKYKARSLKDLFNFPQFLKNHFEASQSRLTPIQDLIYQQIFDTFEITKIKLARSFTQGLGQDQVLLALQALFAKEKHVYVPTIYDLAGANAKIQLEKYLSLDYKIICFSHNVNNHHQIAVFVDCENATVILIDSLNCSATLTTAQNQLKEKLISFQNLQFITLPSSFGKQTDTWSCGIHVISNLLQLVFTNEEPDEFLKVEAKLPIYYHLAKKQQKLQEQAFKQAECNAAYKQDLLTQLSLFVKSHADFPFISDLKVLEKFLQKEMNHQSLFLNEEGFLESSDLYRTRSLFDASQSFHVRHEKQAFAVFSLRCFAILQLNTQNFEASLFKLLRIYQDHLKIEESTKTDKFIRNYPAIEAEIGLLIDGLTKPAKIDFIQKFLLHAFENDLVNTLQQYLDADYIQSYEKLFGKISLNDLSYLIFGNLIKTLSDLANEKTLDKGKTSQIEKEEQAQNRKSLVEKFPVLCELDDNIFVRLLKTTHVYRFLLNLNLESLNSFEGFICLKAILPQDVLIYFMKNYLKIRTYADYISLTVDWKSESIEAYLAEIKFDKNCDPEEAILCLTDLPLLNVLSILKNNPSIIEAIHNTYILNTRYLLSLVLRCFQTFSSQPEIYKECISIFIGENRTIPFLNYFMGRLVENHYLFFTHLNLTKTRPLEDLYYLVDRLPSHLRVQAIQENPVFKKIYKDIPAVENLLNLLSKEDKSILARFWLEEIFKLKGTIKRLSLLGSILFLNKFVKPAQKHIALDFISSLKPRVPSLLAQDPYYDYLDIVTLLKSLPFKLEDFDLNSVKQIAVMVFFMEKTGKLKFLFQNQDLFIPGHEKLLWELLEKNDLSLEAFFSVDINEKFNMKLFKSVFSRIKCESIGSFIRFFEIMRSSFYNENLLEDFIKLNRSLILDHYQEVLAVLLKRHFFKNKFTHFFEVLTVPQWERFFEGYLSREEDKIVAINLLPVQLILPFLQKYYPVLSSEIKKSHVLTITRLLNNAFENQQDVNSFIMENIDDFVDQPFTLNMLSKNNVQKIIEKLSFSDLGVIEIGLSVLSEDELVERVQRDFMLGSMSDIYSLQRVLSGNVFRRCINKLKFLNQIQYQDFFYILERMSEIDALRNLKENLKIAEVVRNEMIAGTTEVVRLLVNFLNSLTPENIPELLPILCAPNCKLITLTSVIKRLNPETKTIFLEHFNFEALTDVDDESFKRLLLEISLEMGFAFFARQRGFLIKNIHVIDEYALCFRIAPVQRENFSRGLLNDLLESKCLERDRLVNFCLNISPFLVSSDNLLFLIERLLEFEISVEEIYAAHHVDAMLLAELLNRKRFDVFQQKFTGTVKNVNLILHLLSPEKRIAFLCEILEIFSGDSSEQIHLHAAVKLFNINVADLVEEAFKDFDLSQSRKRLDVLLDLVFVYESRFLCKSIETFLNVLDFAYTDAKALYKVGTKIKYLSGAPDIGNMKFRERNFIAIHRKLLSNNVEALLLRAPFLRSQIKEECFVVLTKSDWIQFFIEHLQDQKEYQVFYFKSVRKEDLMSLIEAFYEQINPKDFKEILNLVPLCDYVTRENFILNHAERIEENLSEFLSQGSRYVYLSKRQALRGESSEQSNTHRSLFFKSIPSITPAQSLTEIFEEKWGLN